MRKTRTWVLVLSIVVFIVGILAFFIFIPGKSSAPTVISSQPNIIEDQFSLEENLLADYAKGTYTLQNPYIIQDPYGNSPLTALVIFETPEPSLISVLVKGKDIYSNLVYGFDNPQIHHEIPVIGLYPDTKNLIEITSSTSNGKTEKTSLFLTTEPLSYGIHNHTLITSKPEAMEPGWTLVNTDTYKYFLDSNGDIRWFLSFKSCDILDVLPNGHLLMAYLATAPYSSGDSPDKIVEISLLGKISAYYFTPLIHHDIIPYGNSYLSTVNENIYQFDQQTGTLNEQSLSLIDYFPSERNFEYIEDSQSLHVNSLVSGGELGTDVLVSARNQHALIIIDYETKKLKWIIGTPVDWPQEYQQYLLQPVGENFEWFWMQHAPQVLPDLDSNADTLDIVLFDNGAFRNNQAELTEAEEYSRIVHYRIDKKRHTIEQLWEYGKDRGRELYSYIKGSAMYLPITGNYLGAFATVPSISDPENYDGVIVEVNSQKEPIFEVRFSNTQSLYRVYRIDVAGMVSQEQLGKHPGKFLENDYPYIINNFPQIVDTTTVSKYFHSVYRQVNNKWGNNFQLWINRAKRFGLIDTIPYKPLELNSLNISLVGRNLHIDGKVMLPEEQKNTLYLMLKSENTLLAYDLSSAYFSEPDAEGMTHFYVNYFNTANIPLEKYTIGFYVPTTQGINITETGYNLDLSINSGVK